MGKALYRKYRSKNLSEVIGQEHITTSLGNALKQGKISHAYLFTGPRGTGKTSTARILAYEINNLPYDEEANHLDIIEIDAASNRRIDEIREIRERVHNAPAMAKYKVYIIDEVHMLTREAFNALLKTLEEPPEHVIFILATTEAHKLPETIISRTQRYTFRPIERDKVVAHLKSIAKSEGIKVANDALSLIAEHGEGSFRDSISLLDQVRHSDKSVSLDTVQRSLGIAPGEAIRRLVDVLARQQPSELLQSLHDMRDQGYHSPQIAKQLAEQLRHQLLSSDSPLSSSTLTTLLRNLLQVPVAADPDRLLEIVLLEVAVPEKPGTVVAAAPPPAKQAEPPKAEGPKPPKINPGADAKPAPPEEKKPTNKKPVKPKSELLTLEASSWQAILQAIKARHNTLYSVARMAVPSFADKELILTFSFPFHQKRLNDARNKQIIGDVIAEATGQKVTITCLVDVNARNVPAALTQPATPDPDVENISNIFGGGEVLE